MDYSNKIAFWTAQHADAIANNDSRYSIERCAESLAYFRNKQTELTRHLAVGGWPQGPAIDLTDEHFDFLMNAVNIVMKNVVQDFLPYEEGTHEEDVISNALATPLRQAMLEIINRPDLRATILNM